MKFFADLHIHSRYSLATSKLCVPEMLDLWGRKKGIKLLATGDALHPGWIQELKEKLEPDANGLFTLRNAFVHQDSIYYKSQKVHFILSTEVNCIYKVKNKVHRVHHCIYFPEFQSMEKLQVVLSKFGNCSSDGRPLLHLDSRDLLECILSIDPSGVCIPAHIWTPWYSILGSKSGFESIEECFRDLSEHIFAVETGLSSNPAMNRRVRGLDKFTLVSNSDAHSPENIAREATIFDTDLAYDAVMNCLRAGDEMSGYRGTIEFFPEEGKYFLDGHRDCKICFTPDQTLAHKGCCPVCKKSLTIGVLNRINASSDPGYRSDIVSSNFVTLTPLKNILSELHKVNVTSKRITALYESLLRSFGSEIEILINTPHSELKTYSNDFADAIDRLRTGDVKVTPGFDGKFGSVSLFS